MVITLSVPYGRLVPLLGEMGPDVRVIVWDMEDDAPAGVRESLAVVAVPYYKGGATLLSRTHRLPNLRLLQLPSAGYEHAIEHVPVGVALANARGVHDAGTSEMAVGLALAVLRGIDDAARDMTTGTWRWRELTSLADRHCVIVGFGSIGRALATRLEAMEATVTAVARTARIDQDGRRVHSVEELPALLGEAEIVFAVTPLTQETQNLIDARFLSLLPDGALLVNVGRGRVVDQDALLAETASGRIRAALDVTDPEPLPPDHPLWSTPGVLITPHIAGAVRAVDRRFAALLRRQVEAVLQGGELENVVATGPTSLDPGGEVSFAG